MHRPFGLMAELVDNILKRGTRNAELGTQEKETDHSDGEAAGEDAVFAGVPRSEFRVPSSEGPLLLKWCLWEVIEPCREEDRSCSRCPLWGDCAGRAREAEGYFPIDDAIAQKSRASREAWEAEMLCRRPLTESRVFTEFDAARHVAPVGYNAGLPLYRAIDFGYANPFVCLWAQVEDCGVKSDASRERELAGTQEFAGNRELTLAARAARGRQSDPDLSRVRLRVIGEYVARERPVSEHARQMAARDPGPVAATYADPAGWQRSDVTGTGPCQELARLGMRVRTPRAGILEGVELVRRLLKERPGGPGLVIDPSCRWLARAMQEYHWDETADGRRQERPAKDGADHLIDALRYLMTGLWLRRGAVRERRW